MSAKRKPPTLAKILKRLPADADPRAVKWLRALLTKGKEGNHAKEEAGR